MGICGNGRVRKKGNKNNINISSRQPKTLTGTVYNLFATRTWPHKRQKKKHGTMECNIWRPYNANKKDHEKGKIVILVGDMNEDVVTERK